MERQYVNSDGMHINVTEDHLKVAVQIKLELQSASPGRRCNWSQHKDLMMMEGYLDSDVNESYRCLVKDYQKRVGSLPSVEKYADLVSDGKLNSVKNLLGDLAFEKHETQKILKEYRKVRKSLLDSVMIAEEVRNAWIDNVELSIPHYCYQPRLNSSKNKCIVVLTDWHIGAIVSNVAGNNYNIDIAKSRLKDLADDVLDYCNAFNVNEVTIAYIGDIVEHVSMRNQQSHSAELNMSHQIVKASRLLIEFIANITEYKNVQYFGVGGNHDRMNGSKNDNLDNDNVMIVVNETVKTFIESSKSERIEYLDNDDIYSYSLPINGVNIKFVHGDLENSGDSNKIDKYESIDKRKYKAIVQGHLHFHRVTERNYGKLEIQIGSLMGANNYSKNHIKATSNASQGLIIVRDNGDLIPIRIDLQKN